VTVTLPGGCGRAPIGAHPAAGTSCSWSSRRSGWVARTDGMRHPVEVGQGARWAADEVHTSGTDANLTALVVEGSSLRLFEPERS
jgi:hypothetical protein